jgi:hypothetical protein
MGAIAAKPQTTAWCKLCVSFSRVALLESRIALVESREKGLASGHEICISARSATWYSAGIRVATDLDDIPVRPLV